MILHAILNGGSPTDILKAIVFGAIAVLFSISVHEFGHALVAYICGDYSQKMRGRMTLNPIKHLNPFGMILFLLFGFGWANPVVMDSRNFKKPKLGIILTSLAGAFNNFLFGFIWVFLLVFCIGVQSTFNGGISNKWVFLTENLILLFNYLSVYNISFGIFNLIPIPPLDGSKIIAEILPNKYKYKYLSLERYSLYIFFALIFILRYIDFISPLVDWLKIIFMYLSLPITSAIFG